MPLKISPEEERISAEEIMKHPWLQDAENINPNASSFRRRSLCRVRPGFGLQSKTRVRPGFGLQSKTPTRNEEAKEDTVPSVTLEAQSPSISEKAKKDTIVPSVTLEAQSHTSVVLSVTLEAQSTSISENNELEPKFSTAIRKEKNEASGSCPGVLAAVSKLTKLVERHEPSLNNSKKSRKKKTCTYKSCELTVCAGRGGMQFCQTVIAHQAYFNTHKTFETYLLELNQNVTMRRDGYTNYWREEIRSYALEMYHQMSLGMNWCDFGLWHHNKRYRNTIIFLQQGHN